MVGDKSSG